MFDDEDDEFGILPDQTENDQVDGFEGADSQDQDFDVVLEEGGEDTPDDQDEQQAQDDDELSGFTGKFKKRLEREQRAKMAERQRANQLEQELAAMRAQTAEHMQRSVDAEAQGIDETLKLKRQQFAKLRAELDPDKAEEEATLIEEIATLNVRKREIANFKQHQQRQAPPPRAEPVEQPGIHNRQTQAWMARNAWFTDPKFAPQAAAARAIDQQMAAEGMSPTEAGYFAELDRRLARQVQLPTTRRPDNHQRTVNVGDIPNTKRRTVTLDAADQRFMRQLGLDPTNKAHVKAFALEKQRQAKR